MFITFKRFLVYFLFVSWSKVLECPGRTFYGQAIIGQNIKRGCVPNMGKLSWHRPTCRQLISGAMPTYLQHAHNHTLNNFNIITYLYTCMHAHTHTHTHIYIYIYIKEFFKKRNWGSDHWMIAFTIYFSKSSIIH